MKTLIQIIFVKALSGIGKKSQTAYDMRMAQVIAHVPNKDGVVEPLVGELVLPQDLKETQPGFYLVDFRLSVSQQKRIESVVNSLTPCDQKGNPLPAPAPQKQAA
jgi:hypothetical protein